MRISFRLPAGAGSRFAPDAFASLVGRSLNFDLGTGVLMAAHVEPDGRAAVLSLDCGEESARRIQAFNVGETPEYSLGFDAQRNSITMIPIAAAERPQLRRIRLPLDSHSSDLLIVLPVGDVMDTGSLYVQREVKRAESDSWSWLDWDDAYDRLAKEWRNRFEL